MKLGSYRRIIKTDYPAEYQDVVEQLGTSINKGFNDFYNLADHNITFGDNISATIATFNVTVDANGNPSQQTQVPLNNNQTKAQGVVLLNATGTTNTSLLPSGGVFISFVNNSNSIIVKNIQGLQANNQYTLTVLCI